MEESFEPIDIVFELEYNDVKKAYFERVHRNFLLILSASIALLQIVCYVILILFGPVLFDLFTLIIFSILEIFYIIMIIMIISAQKKEWLSSLHLPKQIHCVIGESGIFYERSFSQINMSWQYIINFVETKTVYRIHLSNVSIFLIPKRVLNETDIAAINKLARRKLLTRAKLRT
ncbi:MAG: YcxB family protein [Asgard group archaeon]|nr:YcxB family protein [Asgard group archaeon]